ncbi:GNAT family N-acetyltransferase [Frigidibacter albus]|uniref:GNAT family N-acetyltransferase n=2 Tax=Frigidibacter albus TaxID=1465486 RepID=A0A6L8VCN5_9RHOB|nr:GNAT family N-acetyltransferase [Frigidibacter albus]MZQ88077.1 GNAT family N-acetyltransferase [Frigidibacter albus]NBE30249.1 GNAT family N-acetyltransferase [Frigidibacter albus]GGH47614.1 N-acetyltransferase GCN5 [Frigidibacter albus]
MILTDRLILRPARMEDLMDLHTIMSDPRAMRYWSHAAHAGTERTERYLTGMVAAVPEAEEYMVELRAAPGRVVGKAGCWRPDEVGYIFHPDVWGKGYAYEALSAILPRAFARSPDLPAITADVDPRNTASVRLLERLGFELRGRAENTFEVEGVWTDSVFLSLPRARSVSPAASIPG